ncbi:MAG: type II CAAX endopeptidase family protein [Gemmatimonadota bacterium]
MSALPTDSRVSPTTGPFRTWVTTRQLPLFFVLAFVLSWLPWGLAAVGVISEGWQNPLGPLLALLIVVGIAERWPGVRRELSRLVAFRAHWGWYLAAVGLPVLVRLVAIGATARTGGLTISTAGLQPWTAILTLFPIVVLFGGPFGEEPGWRGYALPRLARNRSLLAATGLLAVPWALWHLPLFFEHGRLDLANLIPEILQIGLVAIVLTWIYFGSGQNVVLAILLHGVNNTLASYLRPLVGDADQPRLSWALAVGWAVSALIILAAGGLRERAASGANTAIRR